MKYIFTILSCFFLVPSLYAESNSSLSQNQIVSIKNEVANTPINTFRFLGNALVCKSESADDHYACFRIGNLKIGEKYQPRDKAWKDVPQKNGVTASVHPIISNEKHNAYWVIGHKNGKMTSIQLTGNFPHKDLTFSTIKLTDSKKRVRKILGPRFQETNVESIKGQMWDYAPFQISIEFVDERVYSIRITE